MDETPVAEATKEAPKAMDLSKLKQKPVDKRAPRASTKAKPKVPIYKEPPRGQHKGPIIAGPTDWIVCSTCSKLFGTKEAPIRYGIRKRHAKRHLRDHQMGRIRRPTAKS